VHSTDNIQETKDNLKALGLDDLYTARTFADLRQVFGALNAVDELQYVVRSYVKKQITPAKTSFILLNCPSTTT
jgi:hypothetical protein